MLPIQPPLLISFLPPPLPTTPHPPPANVLVFSPPQHDGGHDRNRSAFYLRASVFHHLSPCSSHSFSSTQVYFCCESNKHLFLKQTTDPLDFPLGMCKSLFLHISTSIQPHTRGQQTPSSCGTGSSAFPENGVSYVSFIPPSCNSLTVLSDLEDYLDPG